MSSIETGLEQLIAAFSQQAASAIDSAKTIVASLGLAARMSGELIRLIERRQNEILRKGLIPHQILLKDIATPPSAYALSLAQHLVESDCQAAAEFLRHIAAVIEQHPPKFALRIIFPEIEETFREKVYKADADGISTFREARLIVLSRIAHGTPEDCMRIIERTDFFLLMQLAFLDITYSNVTKIESGKTAPNGGVRQAYLRFRRSLKYVGNRHEIVHGLKIEHRDNATTDKILKNVLTLYVSAVRISEYLSELLLANGDIRLTRMSNLTSAEVVQLRRSAADTFRKLRRLLASEP